jgi:hypothetical protein
MDAGAAKLTVNLLAILSVPILRMV